MYLPVNLKLLRKRLNLTQEEMAIKTGISRSKLNAYENEHTEPSLEGLLQLSSFYKYNIRHTPGSFPQYLHGQKFHPHKATRPLHQ